MISHVAAVALLNEAKVLAHPASVDNLPTSGGKEDHVSMGMTAALKLRTIVENAENLIAIELARRRGRAGVSASAESRRRRRARLRTASRRFRPPLNEDRSLSLDIERVAAAIRDGEFDSETEKL